MRRQPDSPLRVALVAGEHSGDQLGFKLMRALREARSGDIAFSGVGGEAMEAEGLEESVSDRRHRGHGHSSGAGPAADAPRAHPDDRGGHCRRAARRPRHHRQPRLHPSGRPPGARGAAELADRRLCQSQRLGLAARPRQGDARLCRLRAGAAAIRAGRLSAVRRAALRLCRPSADRTPWRAEAKRGRGAPSRFAGRRSSSSFPARADPK